jgi:hypothetical protein
MQGVFQTGNLSAWQWAVAAAVRAVVFPAISAENSFADPGDAGGTQCLLPTPKWSSTQKSRQLTTPYPRPLHQHFHRPGCWRLPWLTLAAPVRGAAAATDNRPTPEWSRDELQGCTRRMWLPAE